MRLLLSLLVALLLIAVVNAQEESQTPYEIALQRIQEAEASGTRYLVLRGIGLEVLPSEIGNLSNLQMLDLSENQLTSLPVEIGNLSNLQELYSSDNQLHSLPSEIGNLSNLEYLYLSDNQLHSLPSEIGNLSNLQTLNLEANRLTSLPREIGSLTSLCLMNIKGNNFQSIPLELHLLKQLGTLDGCVSGGLLLDDYLLDTLPEEVANGGTSAILDYLENEAWWHLQRLILGATGTVGILTAIVLALRWKNRRGKSKRKNEELA
jgi:Leucine-rich repeat (LRR) protein